MPDLVVTVILPLSVTALGVGFLAWATYSYLGCVYLEGAEYFLAGIATGLSLGAGLTFAFLGLLAYFSPRTLYSALQWVLVIVPPYH